MDQRTSVGMLGQISKKGEVTAKGAILNVEQINSGEFENGWRNYWICGRISWVRSAAQISTPWIQALSSGLPRALKIPSASSWLITPSCETAAVGGPNVNFAQAVGYEREADGRPCRRRSQYPRT